ncbi:hypothetical protein LOD99_772 [Oopsacas minuta]|uniref:Gustatory receptor n=1 Tax=Oopsacas minuta TaxID=111878 RepID=A0AAV7JZY1_9METZ|nr:hypothetical protein LOD99_772 [Oopsacas minuta]
MEGARALEASLIDDLILTVVPLPFCLLTLVLLIYYIRRRYKLYQEVKRVPREFLLLQSYQNYLKNLRIKCVITNFIILILIIEFADNMLFALTLLWVWILSFDLRAVETFGFLFNVGHYMFGIVTTLRLSLVPVLSFMMDFLWFVYMKNQYRYTMMKWIVYIVLRDLYILIASYLIDNGSPRMTLSDAEGYRLQFVCLTELSFAFISIFDFIQLVYYSRKFYLLLKSREKEIKLFYFDKKAYLDSKFIRLHFSIATVLVITALFFLTFGFAANLLMSMAMDSSNILVEWEYYISLGYLSIFGYILRPSLILYKLLINLNYLFICGVIVLKYFGDKKKLSKINEHIKPVMEDYRNSLYNNVKY